MKHRTIGEVTEVRRTSGGLVMTMKLNLEAFQRAALRATEAAENFKRAMATLAAACKRRPRSQRFTPRHAFTVGSFDLVCRVCGLGPEECGR